MKTDQEIFEGRHPLLIGAETDTAIAAVIEYAKAHPLSIRQLMEIQAHPERCPGEFKEHTISIPSCYRCVYSIEQHPTKWMRHLSVSVETAKQSERPCIAALRQIMVLFGFQHQIGMLAKNGLVYDEPDGRAINILEPLDYVP